MGWTRPWRTVSYGDPESMARQIKRAVHEATALWCSIGVGDIKLRTKRATGFAKPAGVFKLTEENWNAAMGPLPTDALWGIGARTARKLFALGIRTVAELANADEGELAGTFGPNTRPWLPQLARGDASEGTA